MISVTIYNEIFSQRPLLANVDISLCLRNLLVPDLPPVKKIIRKSPY